MPASLSICLYRYLSKFLGIVLFLVIGFWLLVFSCCMCLTVALITNQGLTRQYLHNFQPFITDLSLCLHCIFKRYVMHFIIHDANKYVIAAFNQAFYRMIAHSACDQPVKTRRGTASLNMPQNANSDFCIRQIG